MERGLVSQIEWLEPPEAGTSVCGGFDGSDVDDATVIRLETRDGHQFTPRYGPSRRPTIWLPAEWNGVTPRAEVRAAWAEIVDTYKVRRVYCDPFKWATELDDWAKEYGEDVFLEWRTNRPRQMHEALDRFTTDLANGAITHDGCPITALHVANARKLANVRDAYILGKPAQHQKIDAAVTSVLAHEAAADERAAGWLDDDGPSIFFLS
jgi:phage terminase large subunit-like protein